MYFKEAKRRLLSIFDQNNFNRDMRAKKWHTNQIVINTCSNGTKILVSFPGYKATLNRGKIIYDYRVDITKNGVTTALSHTNIIADIYNKIVEGNISSQNLKEILIEISREGNFEIEKIKNRLPYTSKAPTKAYRMRIKNAHKNKFYNEAGNLFDLAIEELILSIKWIVLQEDINYPIPKFEGRRMPFARYLETIFITEDQSHTLEEVINRTLSHSIPSRWAEMDYSFRNDIK